VKVAVEQPRFEKIKSGSHGCHGRKEQTKESSNGR
jgi:hypothetical protein